MATGSVCCCIKFATQALSQTQKKQVYFGILRAQTLLKNGG